MVIRQLPCSTVSPDFIIPTARMYSSMLVTTTGVTGL